MADEEPDNHAPLADEQPDGAADAAGQAADEPQAQEDAGAEDAPAEAPAEGKQGAGGEAASQDAPGEDAAGEADEAPSDQDAPGEDAAPDAAAAPSEAASAGAAQPPEPEEELSPKQRRRRTRSLHRGEVRAQRSPEERQAERVAGRSAKAVRRRARRLQERSKAKAAEKAPAAPLAPVHAAVQGARKVRLGVVISDKASKTITVRIDVARRHRRYEKIVRSSSTLHAHDENDDARIGDVVRVVESRPLSRTKRWRLVDVVERAQ